MTLTFELSYPLKSPERETKMAPRKNTSKAKASTSPGVATLDAKRKLDEARAALDLAEAEAREVGIEVSGPAIKSDTRHGFTDTVWIGCKLPTGLVIQLCTEINVDRPTFGGAVKPTKMFTRVGEQVRLKGYAVPFGKIPKYSIIGDFGLTEVKREFWEKWKEQNKGLELLQKGLVFAHGEKESTSAYAAEHAELKCGLEPLNPEGDPRTDQSESPNLSDVEADTERQSQRRSA